MSGKLNIERKRRRITSDLSWHAGGWIEWNDVTAWNLHFQNEVNPLLNAMFEKHKPHLPEQSVFVRRGSMGRWHHCPNDLADEVEQILRAAEERLS